jgi:PhzF family phenazine biosynthesis protein
MAIEIFQVDAFTDKPFSGNPAAVCVLDGPADEEWMQNVAAEMNISETAFLYREDGGYNLRWFTPTTEVELCGHATLASAHILWETGRLGREETAEFHTLSGVLTAKRRGSLIELDFPLEPETEAETPAGLLESLAVTPLYVGKNRFDYIVEVDSEEIVRGLRPDFAVLKKVPARGVMVTSVSDAQEYDFVSRFFGPAAGIDEDPVTGSAHCCLGPYWQKRLGKSEFTAYQASPRGGVVHVSVKGDRVLIVGRAVTVLRAELY